MYSLQELCKAIFLSTMITICVINVYPISIIDKSNYISGLPRQGTNKLQPKIVRSQAVGSKPVYSQLIHHDYIEIQLCRETKSSRRKAFHRLASLKLFLMIRNHDLPQQYTDQGSTHFQFKAVFFQAVRSEAVSYNLQA